MRHLSILQQGFRVRSWAAAAVAAGAMFLLPRAVGAQQYSYDECGGGQGQCACGSYVVGDVTLASDLGPCDGYESDYYAGEGHCNVQSDEYFYGLRIAATDDATPITIDCQGHRLYTNRNNIGNIPGVGIDARWDYFRGGWSCTACFAEARQYDTCSQPCASGGQDACKQNVTIKNCVIEGFDQGISFQSTVNWTLQNNTIRSRWTGSVLATTEIGIRGSFGASNGTGIKILENDILEVGQQGIYLANLHMPDSEISGNRVTVYETAADSYTNEAGIYLSTPLGQAAARLPIHSNYIDCATKTVPMSTDCTLNDLYLDNGGALTPRMDYINVYNNVFSGRGVGIRLESVGHDISFQSPGNDVTKDNIFTSVEPQDTGTPGSCNTASNNLCDYDCVTPSVDPDCYGLPRTDLYNAENYRKACLAGGTWTSSRILQENTCLAPNTLYTFDPPYPPGDGTRDAIGFAADNLILDCDWEAQFDFGGKLRLNPAVLDLFATSTVGIHATSTRLASNNTYQTRRRGTIVGCELEGFGNGIKLENTEDFLLRWNNVWTIRDGRYGQYYNVLSDHLQDCFPDKDGDGVYCEKGVDGDGVSDVDPNYPAGLRLNDYRHVFANPAYRPGGGAPMPFNWLGVTGKQVLYYFGPTIDGLVFDGVTDPFLANLGHLTIVGAKNIEVRNFGGLLGGGMALANGDPLKLACVGMSLDNGKCDTAVASSQKVTNVSVSGAQVGLYAVNSYNIAVSNSQFSSNGYGVLMFDTSSTTLGCATAGCIQLLTNNEGVRAQSRGVVANRLLVWNALFSANTNGGLLAYDVDQVITHHTTIDDTGTGGATDAIGLLLYGSQYGQFYENTISDSQGDNVALTRSYSGRDADTTHNFFWRNTFSGSVSRYGVYAEGGQSGWGNFFGWNVGFGSSCNYISPTSPCYGYSVYDVRTWPIGLQPNEYNNTTTRNFAGGMHLRGYGLNVFYKLASVENGKNAAGATLREGSDGIWLDGPFNQYLNYSAVNNNTGWGLRAEDAGSGTQIAFNSFNGNAQGGAAFSEDEYLQSGYTDVDGNQFLDNNGPGIQLSYARNMIFRGNVVQIPDRFGGLDVEDPPGIRIGDSTQITWFGNRVTSTGTALKQPYFWVGRIPGSRVVDGAEDFSATQYYSHTVARTNAAGPSGSATVVTYQLQDGVGPTATFNDTSDTVINEKEPTTPKNGDATLAVDGDIDNNGTGKETRVLLRWVPFSTQDLVLPPGCTVLDVKLTVNVTNSSADRFAIYGLRNYFIDAEATWNRPFASGSWNIPGAKSTFQDQDGINLASGTGFGTGVLGSYTHTLNAYGRQLVQEWVSGLRLAEGLLIAPDNGAADDDGFAFDKEENGTAANRPKLTVTCALHPPLYYFYGTSEYVDAGVVQTLSNPEFEKTCQGSTLDWGKRCTAAADCAGIGATCTPLRTYHLQVANNSTFFQFTNLKGVASKLSGADPLEFNYAGPVNARNLELENCIGPCVRIVGRNTGFSDATTTFDGLEIRNPFGHGVEVTDSSQVTILDARITPGSGTMEGDNISMKSVANFDLSCVDCTSDPLGGGGTGGGALTGRNDLRHGADPANRFWEVQVGGMTTGNIQKSSIGSAAADRGAFEQACQNGHDWCCLAQNDTPDVCDPDCGLDAEGKVVDPDCPVCTSAAGNCCLPVIDTVCDADCPGAVDPDCWKPANAVKNFSCPNPPPVGDGCDYDCSFSGNYDRDCGPRVCSNATDGCCNASNDEPDDCDADCTYGSFAASIVDPDCGGIGNGSDDGCWPVASDGFCDPDCPAGLDPNCGTNGSGDDGPDGTCNGQSDSICDPDCLERGVSGSNDPDCRTGLCSWRPAYVPGNTVSTDGGAGCNTDPATGFARSNGVCDIDCGPLTGGQPVDPDCVAVDCCFPAVDNACDTDCAAGVDPDCTTPAQWPAVASCQPWLDGMCDYGCPAGRDPDCGALTIAYSGAACDRRLNGVCDYNCGFTYSDGLPADPDCATLCNNSADGCCQANTDNRCDPDCSIDAGGLAVDPDCINGCTNTAGNCCLAADDGVCDADCPAVMDPDCTSDINFCGNRSYLGGNTWPASYASPYKDDLNYFYEEGIPNTAASCVAPIIRFHGDAAGNADRFATQDKPLRSSDLATRELARGDVKITVQMGDYEGSDLKLGLWFATEQATWKDPSDISTTPPGTGWWPFCDGESYWCSESYFSDNTSQQPLSPADPPLPLPKMQPPAGLPQPPPPPHPSVDNGYEFWPLTSRIGQTDPVVTRPWPAPNTGFDLNYLTDVTFYWAAASSCFNYGEGCPAGSVTYANRRLPVWLEVNNFEQGNSSCPWDTDPGCFSGPGLYNNITLCDASCQPSCTQACTQADAETRKEWTRRQRMMLDLQGPTLPALPVPNFGAQGTSDDFPCAYTVNRYDITWPWATGEVTSGEYQSWTNNQAHYEIWFGSISADIIARQDTNGNAADGPFVWEDISAAASGLPHEEDTLACDWTVRPRLDANLGVITCNQGANCLTQLWTKLTGTIYFNICALDDFGNVSNCLFSDPKPWAQTQYGDVFAGHNLEALTPPPTLNSTFLLTSGGSINNWSSTCASGADFGSGACKLPFYSNAGWTKSFPSYTNDFSTPAGTLWFLQGFNGSNFSSVGGVLDKLRNRYGAARVIDLATYNTCDGSGSSLPSVLGGNIYYWDGSTLGDCVTSSALSFANNFGSQDGSALFLINGNLYIGDGVQYTDAPGPTSLKNIASAAWLVLGGVQIDPSVTQVDSTLIALGDWANRATACNAAADPLTCGSIMTGDDTASPKALTARGVFVARQFLLERVYPDLVNPAERFIYDGRILANTPLGLEQAVQSLPVWK
ncbi:MAG: right-handed parallel beta-helix repeat-containing protein [bacterium]|nr:right-handed parallel beta-helix repeat-containing protein [bacterium]